MRGFVLCASRSGSRSSLSSVQNNRSETMHSILSLKVFCGTWSTIMGYLVGCCKLFGSYTTAARAWFALPAIIWTISWWVLNAALSLIVFLILVDRISRHSQMVEGCSVTCAVTGSCSEGSGRSIDGLVLWLQRCGCCTTASIVQKRVL